MNMETVYAEYFARVYRFLLGLTRSADLAEELTQETFSRALQPSAAFDGRCSVVTWLCSIARNCYIDYCRRRRHEQPLAQLPEESAPDFTERLMDREQALRTHRALHTLEEPYKEVFMLRVFGELPHREIGVLFGQSESWARVTYYRARLLLQQRMKEEET